MAERLQEIWGSKICLIYFEGLRLSFSNVVAIRQGMRGPVFFRNTQKLS
jgi:hypothetical protein